MKKHDSIKIKNTDEIDKLYTRTAKFIAASGNKSVIIKLIKDNYVYFIDNGFIFYKSELIDNDYFLHNGTIFKKDNFIKCRE